jgi:hypothetical protein
MKHCAPRDPQRVPKPKYEATARQVRPTIGYPNSTTGSMYNGTALLSGEATDGAGSTNPRLHQLPPVWSPDLQQKRSKHIRRPTKSKTRKSESKTTQSHEVCHRMYQESGQDAEKTQLETECDKARYDMFHGKFVSRHGHDKFHDMFVY